MLVWASLSLPVDPNLQILAFDHIPAPTHITVTRPHWTALLGPTALKVITTHSSVYRKPPDSSTTTDMTAVTFISPGSTSSPKLAPEGKF